MPYIPHTDEDTREMLAAIGVQSIDDLFDEIPKALKQIRLTAIPDAMNEMQLTRFMAARAKQDETRMNFIGAGAYEHHIPAAVWDIVSRGEFMTAYTPYQAEASQGTLQLLYEFQTMMVELTAMEAANASLYDGAQALAEAVLMAARLQKKQKTKTILVPKTVHPYYRQALKTLVGQQHIQLVEVDFDTQAGQVTVDGLTQSAADELTAVVISQPNFFGVLSDVDQLTDWVKQQGALVIAVVNPLSLALLKPPGEWGQQGADIVCGEGQPLGVPLASGGPYFGFMTCKKHLVRQLPGRIVGRTVDQSGCEGYTLTLQAREQHIRRSKATSNICTNQGLLVSAATVYLSLLGSQGLLRVAQACHANALKLQQALTAIDGIDLVFNSVFFHEFVLRFKQPVPAICEKLASLGMQAGFQLQQVYPGLDNCLLVCVTETKTDEDIHEFVSAVKGCVC